MDMSQQFYCQQRLPHLRLSAIGIAGADDPLPQPAIPLTSIAPSQQERERDGRGAGRMAHGCKPDPAKAGSAP
jgi:hypothetical protein